MNSKFICKLSEEIHKKCAEFAKKTYPNHSHFDTRPPHIAIQDILYGKLAEFAFYEIIKNNSNAIINEVKLDENVQGDGGIDFIIKTKNKEIKIDVKSLKRPHHTNVSLSKSSNCDIFSVIELNPEDNICKYIGSLYYDDISNIEQTKIKLHYNTRGESYVMRKDFEKYSLSLFDLINDW